MKQLIRVSNIKMKEINKIMRYLDEQGSSWYGSAPVNPYGYDDLYFIEFKPSFYLLRMFREDLKNKLGIDAKPLICVYDNYGELVEQRALGVEI